MASNVREGVEFAENNRANGYTGKGPSSGVQVREEDNAGTDHSEDVIGFNLYFYLLIVITTKLIMVTVIF